MKHLSIVLTLLISQITTIAPAQEKIVAVAIPADGLPPSPVASSVKAGLTVLLAQNATQPNSAVDSKSPDNKSLELEAKKDPPAEPKKPVRKKIGHLGSLSSQKIPGQPWRIHDALRPRPVMVTPGKMDSLPPSDATILFDGSDLSNWCHRGGDDELFEPEWKIVDGCLEVEPRTGSLYTIESFASCQLHIEWMIPEGTTGVGQGRGNSGIKLMERFEVQVLESFGSKTYADGQAGSIYGQYPPMVNAVRKPGQWQSYDIFFQAPKFEDDKLIRSASMTVLHNGVLVQLHRVLPGPTGAREPKYSPLQPAAPIMLQDHGNRIRFRNIWLRTLAD